MAKLTDDADYDAGEQFENVSSPLSDAGNHDNYYGRRLRCVLHGLPKKKTKPVGKRKEWLKKGPGSRNQAGLRDEEVLRYITR
ncbi:unnamed protein product [Protopolystoma xenopodis]|uniref:Uncharacterized protein n=1 Tax=Protopolystoma xenopodis TaxID=117903 RepID=A0A448W9W8_9PLAT|nr:unnamed protein product [Protopolystoma xenopodis]